jgi:hypothetical protein
VTVKVSFQNQPKPVRKLRRPRFSFFHSSIVKKQTSHPGQSIPNDPEKNPVPPISKPMPIQETLRAKDIVASSAAALVSDAAYRPLAFPKSTTDFEKTRKKSKALICKGNSDSDLKYA